MDANWKSNPVIWVCGVLGAIAVGVTALPKIWRAAVAGGKFIIAVDRITPVLSKIAAELSTNGGESIKDKVNQAAADSRLAITLIEEVKAKQAQIESKQNQETDELTDLQKKFARFVVHEAKGDLHKAMLLRESEAWLKKSNEKKAEEEQ